MEMQEFLKTIKKEFGSDIEFKVKLNDGRVFKSINWDRLARYYDKIQTK